MLAGDELFIRCCLFIHALNFSVNLFQYNSTKKYKKVQTTSKKSCPAAIMIRELLYFPDYSVCISYLLCLFCVSTGFVQILETGKVWKVLECNVEIFKALKSLENDP